MQHKPKSETSTDKLMVSLSATAATSAKPTASVVPVMKSESPAPGCTRVTRQNSANVDSLNGDISSHGNNIVVNGPISVSKAGRMKSLLNTQTPNGEIDLLTPEDLLPGKSESLLRKQRSLSDTAPTSSILQQENHSKNAPSASRTVSTKVGSSQGSVSLSSTSSSSSSVKGATNNSGSSTGSKVTGSEDVSSLEDDLKLQLDSSTGELTDKLKKIYI